MSKLPYNDEQLSRILSAKAGGQLIRYGREWDIDDPVEEQCVGGCINQVAFLEPDSTRAAEEYGDYVGNVALRFDRLGFDKLKKMSAEQFLRWIERAAYDL